MVAVRFRDGERVFLKVAIDGNHHRIVRDAAVTRYAGTHCDIRVPQVVVTDSSADPPYVATSPLTGTAVGSRWDMIGTDERTAVLRQIGRSLAGIHAARFARSGHIIGGDTDGLALDEGPWTDVLCNYLEQRAREQLPDRFSDTLDRVCRGLQEHSSHLNDVPTTLLHGDPRPENCFLNSQPGVIDWEVAVVGDPSLDLCFAENQYIERPSVATTDELYHALRSGYRDHVSELPDGFAMNRRVYRTVTFLLLQVATFDYWAPQADEPTEELAEWVYEEISRRINGLYE